MTDKQRAYRKFTLTKTSTGWESTGVVGYRGDSVTFQHRTQAGVKDLIKAAWDERTQAAVEQAELLSFNAEAQRMLNWEKLKSSPQNFEAAKLRTEKHMLRQAIQGLGWWAHGEEVVRDHNPYSIYCESVYGGGTFDTSDLDDLRLALELRFNEVRDKLKVLEEAGYLGL